MQIPRTWLSTSSPKVRRTFLTIGLVTLAFIIFSLISVKDLLAPKGINEIIVNPIPLMISLLGCISTALAWKGRTRIASYLLLTAVFVGFLLIAIFTAQATFVTVAGLVIVVIPIMIAIQSLSEREFIAIVIITILGRSAIQLIGTLKSSSPLTGASAQTAQAAQWISVVIAILFGLYIAFNLNNYAFRVKMILVLGIMTIVPTAIITTISSQNLETNLISQANQNLVFSSSQLATGIESFIQTNLDITRTAAQDPAFISYLGQPSLNSSSQGTLLPRGTELERVGIDTLLALLKKDPINIISVKLLDGFGTVQLSTNPSDLHKFESTLDYFLVPFRDGIPYASPVIISQNGGGSINFSSPIRSASGISIGILDITYSASILQQTIVRNSNKLGPDFSSMLIDENNIILAHSATPDLVYKIINPPNNNTIFDLIFANRLQNLSPDQLTVKMDGLKSGLDNISTIQYFTGNFHPEQIQSSGTVSFSDQAGVAKLSSANWYVITFVPQNTLLAPVHKQTQSIVLLSILIGLISIGIALALTQVLISPILKLTRTSEQITQGDINATASVETKDEIGVLANTFNSMTGRVRDLIGNLEQRVAERTQALERRAVQLQAAADVGSTATRLRDQNELLRQVTRLISQRFDYYHIGVFLVDERGEYAILRAANSDGGQRMLTRGHKLKIGQVGIVGYVTGTGQARIALNVGKDAEFFTNPDLPLTQSEMALPLIVGGKILGALDIQSLQEAAFTQEDIATLKVLADQIAIALENARLFSENRMALESAQRAYGAISSEAWQRLLRERLNTVGYISLTEDQTLPVSGDASAEYLEAIGSKKTVLSNNNRTLYLPIKVRSEVIGAIRLDKPLAANGWSADDINVANTLSDQLGAALDSARLYEDINRRAVTELTISDISSKISGSVNLRNVLRTTVQELGRALPDTEIIIQLQSDQDKVSN